MNTPETDEQINGKPCTRFQVLAGDSLRDALVPSEFARKLERQRNELLEALEHMIETYQYEASMDNPTLLKAKNIVAKAKGETP